MLYKIAHFFRAKMPWLWNLLDIINAFLFSVRFGNRLKCKESLICNQYQNETGYEIKPIRDICTDDLTKFFSRQPIDAFKFFNPHGFDPKSIKNLQNNKAFLGYVFIDKHIIVGYCFNRSFFIGKGFRGRMVDINFRGNGLGTIMNRLLNDIGFGIGLRLFETVNKHNVASYKSALSASNVKIIEQKSDGDLYLEIMNN